MNSEELREEKDSIRGLTISLKECAARIKRLENAIAESGEMMNNIVAKMLVEEKFQHSSLHSSLNEGFEYNCRLQLQKELWQLFQLALPTHGIFLNHQGN